MSKDQFYFAHLTLHDFRCYSQAEFVFTPGIVAITGPNGAGKTNLLEALSLFAPGRGLRRASLSDLGRIGRPSEDWAVVGQAYAADRAVQIGTGVTAESSGKRLVKIDGIIERSRTALGQLLSLSWLTPEQDRLFLDPRRERLAFFDRLIIAYDPDHSRRLNHYEEAMRERGALLRDHNPAEPAIAVWCERIEQTMAGAAVAIAAARITLARQLAHYLDGERGDFPLAVVTLEGTVETALTDQSALHVEEALLQRLAATRYNDQQSGTTREGVHRSDWLVHYATNGMPAAQSSTGEQKALLVGLVLAHAKLVKAIRGAAPILLLDEIAAHLDHCRRRALIDRLFALQTQVFMTGTEFAPFEALEDFGQFLRLKNE